MEFSKRFFMFAVLGLTLSLTVNGRELRLESAPKLYGFENMFMPWTLDIAVDGSGHVWFATRQLGLLRFNGRDLTEIETGLPGNSFPSLLVHDDELVVGSAKGLAVLNWRTSETVLNVQVKDFQEHAGLLDYFVNVAIKASDGTYWIGTDKSVAQISIDGEILLDIPTDEYGEDPEKIHGLHVKTLVEVSPGIFWAGTASGRHPETGEMVSEVAVIRAGAVVERLPSVRYEEGMEIGRTIPYSERRWQR